MIQQGVEGQYITGGGGWDDPTGGGGTIHHRGWDDPTGGGGEYITEGMNKTK